MNRDYIEDTITTVRRHSRDSSSWWVGAAHALADEVESLRAALLEAYPYVRGRAYVHPQDWDWRSESALEVLERLNVALHRPGWREEEKEDAEG